MNSVCVKLYLSGNQNKYRKMLSTEESVYPSFEEIVETTYEYNSGTTLEAGEWFKISNASTKDYKIDLFSENYNTVDFDSLNRREFSKIDFMFIINDNFIFFQNISKSKLASKKRIGSFGEQFEYQTDCNEIVVKDIPDAIYRIDNDSLYFNRLEAITGIFKGIDQLYREATNEETEDFLNNDFISLENNYNVNNVKTANRKRIAMAQKTLSQLNENDKNNIFSYIEDYCPNLKANDNTFSIKNENELKTLLYGIEQRFYTTPVGGEKRIANSIIPLNFNV